jgi:hypothetical protein
VSYGTTREGPWLARGLLFLCFQYSGWRLTDTPRECAGLTRGFAVLGLDRFGGRGLSWLPKAESRLSLATAVRALRECPHLKIEIWGTRFCGVNLDVGHPPSAFARMPTSQNRDMGHPILWLDLDVGHPPECPPLRIEVWAPDLSGLPAHSPETFVGTSGGWIRTSYR